MRVTIGLRSPLAFHMLGPDLLESLSAPPDTVAIRFERWEFVWHPPTEYEDALESTAYGPMLAAAVGPRDMDDVAHAVQRFLSAVAYAYDLPVDDDAPQFLAGDGETDPYNPHGHRLPRAYAGMHKADAPSAIEVDRDHQLQRALAHYREGRNTTSPFYGCLAFRNVLDAVYAVEWEKTRDGTITPEARARDAFIDATAPPLGFSDGIDPGDQSWSGYLRNDVRDAVAHVWRGHRREANPDYPHERGRLRLDSTLLKRLAQRAIKWKWPTGVRVIRRDH